MKISQIPLRQILFLDIETVSQYASYCEVPEKTKEFWSQKSAYQRKERSAEEFYPAAGIWAEFGKIVCISTGFFSDDTGELSFRIKSFYGEEITILEDFKSLITTHFHKPNHYLCAHNGKEFDFPYIARRMVIHGIGLPIPLELFGKKPWEIPHLDTMELWKFGDYKAFTSLDLICHILGIPSSKDDISGDRVGDVYHRERNIKRIVKYCEKDTTNVAQVFLKFRNEKLLKKDHIFKIT